MSAGEFSVEINWMHRKREELPSSFVTKSPESVNARKERARFFYIENISKWEKSDEAQGQKRTQLLNTISTVITVFLATLSVLMPLAVCYLPAWVPWGIGLPLIITVSIVQSVIKSKIEIYKREKEFVPFLAGFLRHPTLASMQPIGEEDLPATDERLRSDLMMREEMEKQHPQLRRPATLDSRYDLTQTPYQQQRVASLASRLDLEVTPFLQQAAAAEYSGMPQKVEKWSSVKGLQGDLYAAAREANLEDFGKKIKQREELALEPIIMDGETVLPNSSLDYPSTSLRSYLEALVQLYCRFSRQFEELDRLRGEGEALYGAAPNYWEPFLELARRAKEAIEQCNKPEIIAQLDEPILIPDFRPQLLLYQLNDQTRHIKCSLETWVAAHPTKRHGAIQEQLALYTAQEVLTAEQLQLFARWIQSHPHEAEQKIIHVKLPGDLKAWIDKHPQMRFETANSLFDRAFEAHRMLQEAKRQFKQVETNAEALTTFEQSVMNPLAAVIAGQDGASKFTKVLRTAFTKLPAVPFAREALPQEPHLRERKIEEIHLNQLLRKVDDQMLFTNRARKYGLRIPLYVLFAVEGIVAIYLSTPWIFWGICVLAVLGEGVSYYVDKKLQRLERKKQALKLQYILRDHPEIGTVPGTKPRLDALKKVQQKYGLEGVRPTWARLLTEEADTPFQSRLELSEEGSQEAAAYLEDALLNLHTRLNQAQKKEDRIAIVKRIKSIEKTLAQRKKTDPTPGQLALKERYEREKALEEMTEQTLYGNKLLAQLNYKQQNFERLAHILPPQLLEREHSLEEMRAYLMTVEVSDQQRHADALQELAALHSDEQIPTPAALNEMRQRITVELEGVQANRAELLKVYQDAYKSVYEPLVREQRQVDAALDKLAEDKIYLKTKLKDYQQKSLQFSRLQQKLTPEFAAAPVLQAEIDLILETLKTEPLNPDPAIDLKALLAHIKEKLGSVPFRWISSNSIKFAAFQKEIAQLRSIPPATRLAIAKLLRELQLLQNDGEYRNKQTVDSHCALITEKLKAIELEIQLLWEYDDTLSGQRRAASPLVRPAAPSSKERLQALIPYWPECAQKIRQYYGELKSYERRTIWWSLPREFREELRQRRNEKR